MLETVYERIKEIRLVNEMEANKLLKEDWALLKVVTETDMSGKSATKFVLGRKITNTPKFIPASEYVPDGPLQEVVDKLPWRRNKWGEWVFAKQAGVSVAPELEDAITKSGGKLSLGDYVYSMSGENGLFFNRKKSQTKGLT